MKNNITLDSTPYYLEKVKQDVKLARREESKRAAASALSFLLFGATMAVGIYAISQGWVDRDDLNSAMNTVAEYWQTAIYNINRSFV